MHLQAGILPPDVVRRDLAAAVQSVPGWRGQLTPVAPEMLYLRLASFGSVSGIEAGRIKDALAQQLSGRPAMSLRFAGGVALEPMGDDSVWARLEGDVELVADLAKFLVDASRRLGIAVDRRVSRRLVRVGRVTDQTTVEYLERLLEVLDAYRGDWWKCSEVALLKRTAGETAEERGVELWDRIPLQG